MPVMVLDASVVLCLAFRDEGLPYSMAAIDTIAEGGALAPSIFWYGIRNALVVSERRDRITAERSNTFLDLVSEMPISIESQSPPVSVLDLARHHQLSVYDAAYLELALREGVPLASLDDSLVSAAKSIKVAHWKSD